MASIEVSCRITSEDKPRYQLQGFLSLPGGNLYEMTPYNGARGDAWGPVDDDLYILKPVKPLIDKQAIDITLSYDEDNVSEREAERWTQESRSKRSTDQIHIDVVAVVDYSVYQRWFARTSQVSEVLKHAETKENIRRHFAHLVNGVNLRFKTASTLYNIHLVGYVIEDQGRGGWFQSVLNEEDYPNNTKIDASNLLPSARDWKNNIPGFPENDHVIVFTAYDLYRMDASVTQDLLGYAYVGTICDKPGRSISLVEYTDNLVDDLLVTAHEMGHAARHDGEYNNTCSGTDAYIMSSSYSAHHNVSITNYFLFSNCSIRYFQTFLDQVLAESDTTSRSCLLESLEPASVTNVTGEWPGQLYNVNEQCQMKYGPTSYMCLDVNSSVSVCKRLYCYLPHRPGLCSSINAVDGTTCGNRQWPAHLGINSHIET
ncbi:metalloprotease mig-17-like [Haliotis rubra]|uniref:metalloprotease mig-17-like n=1 Tax=Haliotis rubra TaxID=36100 RepID=UPI001EE5056C|nr:metalloprotease mig-17-like [Haliotis rubra]